jgi:hypothetical protein
MDIETMKSDDIYYWFMNTETLISEDVYHMFVDIETLNIEDVNEHPHLSGILCPLAPDKHSHFSWF